ncbi:hypothetical protein SCLCIDRAFT_110592 [Scleroderma citrinum Foug A]|uniref:DUF6830 domain-containing protein n=1 Tax=Scleroderma citrinum Foug A TaxID=1036808 RepID=A0A0C3E0Q4_9AGAM|nr:hypothetical protein SCLCIDRAFT_110592 [Scleroderma citrinum Foug A]
MEGAHPTSNSRSPNPQVRYHAQSGYIFGCSPNTFKQMNNGPFKHEQEINMYYPFKSRAEWSLAKFLVDDFMQAQINRFHQENGEEKIIHYNHWWRFFVGPSFTSAEELLGWVDTLPLGPKWQSTVLQVEGYPTTDPIRLFWHDAVEVIASLFGDPIFGADMIFDPMEVTTHLGREYSEWFSVKEAHRIQDSLLEGAMIVPILAASNKTPVTRMMGGLEMHPLFISIGNIPGHIHMAATSHAWQCVTFMPIPKFKAPKGCQSVLQSHVWHKCIKIFTVGLQYLACTGGFMPDPHGYQQLCFTPLAAWTADLPEHLVMLTAADLWNLATFLKKARALQLSGVHLPFWRKHLFVNLSIFLLPEILHACHRFFFDHILPWCKILLGDELDAWYKCHHKCVGVRHFMGGISHVKQMTGREHHNIQRTLVAMISGRVPPCFLRAIHALIDFIYQAQSPMHTESSIQEMESSLREFHDHKDAIIAAGARRTKAAGAKSDFNIPKLELFHSFSTAICNNGGLIRYTADVSERLLITHCKHPFTCMSKNKDFAEQVIQILDREEVMQQFNLYTLLRSGHVPLTNAMCEDEIRTVNPMLAWVASVLPKEQWQIQGPCPVHNYFASGILASNAKTALHVTSHPDATNLLPNDIAMKYHLSDFEAHYLEFLQLHSYDTQIYPAFNSIALWYKLRVQLHSTFHSAQIMPSQAVQAAPPSQEFPYRCCDAILITPPNDGTKKFTYTLDFMLIYLPYTAASYVAQVHAVFQPRAPSRSRLQAALYLEKPLIYVQPFHVVCTPDQQPELRMWTVERNTFHTESGRCEGLVIPIDWVSHALELVPVFGSGNMPADVMFATSQEVYSHFFVNHFSDKEMYNTLHGVTQMDGS